MVGFEGKGRPLTKTPWNERKNDPLERALVESGKTTQEDWNLESVLLDSKEVLWLPKDF